MAQFSPARAMMLHWDGNPAVREVWCAVRAVLLCVLCCACCLKLLACVDSGVGFLVCGGRDGGCRLAHWIDSLSRLQSRRRCTELSLVQNACVCWCARASWAVRGRMVRGKTRSLFVSFDLASSIVRQSANANAVAAACAVHVSEGECG